MGATASNTAFTSTPSGIGNDDSQFHVYIHHRSPDVKKTLASHIYRRLRAHGLRVFLDTEELQVGDNLPAQIVGAIRTASLHIAIFSPRYAESSWCLDELVQMLESGSIIIPVYYHVKPSELRSTSGRTGVYAEALHRLEMKRSFDPQTQEEKPRYDSGTIEGWRNALSHVADISGFDLHACNGDEGVLVDLVVLCVLKKLGIPLAAQELEGAASDRISLLTRDNANGRDIEMGLQQPPEGNNNTQQESGIVATPHYVQSIATFFTTCHGAILAFVALVMITAPVSSAVRIFILFVSALVSVAIIRDLVLKSYNEFSGMRGGRSLRKSLVANQWWVIERIALFLIFIMFSLGLLLVSNRVLNPQHH